MPMRQHQRREHVTVARGQTVDVVAVVTFALQAVVQVFLVRIQMASVGGVDDLKLAHGIAKTCALKAFFDVAFTANDQCLAIPRALIVYGGAQNADIVALGENHAGLCGAGAGGNTAQNVGSRVHTRLERGFIALKVDNRATGHTGVHTGARDGGRDHVDQTRVKRRRDDVIAPERQLAPIGHCDLIGHIHARDFGQGLGAGDFHLVIDGTGVDVQRATEQIRKAQNVVHLVRIVRTTGGHDGVRAHGVGVFGGDFGIGVGHRKNDRIVGHAEDHVLRHGTLGRHAKEHIRALHRVLKRTRIGFRGMGRFPLVHALGAALIDDALGIAHDTVVVLGTHRLDQFQTGDARRTRTVQNDLTVFDLFARDMQRVDQTRRTDHGGAVLVVVKDGNIHFLLQTLFDDETFRRLDVLKVDAAKGRPHQLDRLDDFLGVLGVQLDVDGIHIGEPFKQDGLALHHRFGRQRAKVPQTQDRGAV